MVNSKKNQKRKPSKNWAFRLGFVIFLGIILAISLIWQKEINQYLGLIDNDEINKVGVVTLGSDCNVHFIDVGQGDACIIELPDEKKIIIDGGKDKEKQKLLDYIDDNIKSKSGEALNFFDYAILTHSDEDHCGGLDDIFRLYQIGCFYRPNQLAVSKSQNFTDPGLEYLYGDYTCLLYTSPSPRD